MYVYVWRSEASLNFTELIKQEEAWQFHGCPIPIRKGRKKAVPMNEGERKSSEVMGQALNRDGD